MIVFKKEMSHCQVKYHGTQLKTSTFTVPRLYLFGISKYKIECRGLQHYSVSEDIAMDLVPSSVYNVLAWIVDNDDRTQQDVPGDGSYRKVLVRNVTTRQQVLSMAQDLLYCTCGDRVKTPKHVLLPLTVQHLTKSTELLTFINNCSAACSCNNCSMCAILLRKEAWLAMMTCPWMMTSINKKIKNVVKYFQFFVFPDMCCMILCSNIVLGATCHFFCDSLSHFLCSLTQGFGNFLGFACFFL